VPATLGKHLFTFAVISDSHVNEAEDRSASPYACNRLANGRFRHAVRSVNEHRPAFTVHLGDMANPIPGLSTYEPAAQRFHALAAGLRSPLHLLPGNHCVGDKPTGWVPVPRVGAEALDQYSRVYGKHWYAFRHGPCHFVALDSLLINSGLAAETRQKRWVENELARAAGRGRRLWLLMHYPPYIASPEELGSYDNVDEPGRSWLLSLFERFEIEAAYTGHVHNYFYNRYAGTAVYTVPALSFVRQDYSELYTVEPEDREGGRDDTAKLGYFLVDVFEHGHRNRLVRTGGESLAEDETPAADEADRSAVPAAGSWTGLGVEMRESWLSTVALRTNNSVSPFTRRRARNDWAVLALQEMGMSRVRVPLPELAAADAVERMATLQAAGFDFFVYSCGIPNERTDRLIRAHRALLAGWELILDLDEVEPAARRIAAIVGRQSGDLPCFLNPLRNAVAGGQDRSAVDGANVKHEANYGFHTTDLPQAGELAGRDTVRSTFRGFVFRNRRRGEPSPPPWTAVREVDELGRASGLRHQVHVLFSGQLTAERLEDDRDTANRVAEAALASHLAAGVDLFLDTFEDVDRGYFVRHGLVDRRYNPRLAARVLGHLRQAVAGHDLGELADWRLTDLPQGRQISTDSGGRWRMLILPREPWTIDEVAGRAPGSVLWIDLASGTTTRIATVAEGSRKRLSEPRKAEGPALLIGNDE
jgi:hypothetical protein